MKGRRLEPYAVLARPSYSSKGADHGLVVFRRSEGAGLHRRRDEKECGVSTYRQSVETSQLYLSSVKSQAILGRAPPLIALDGGFEAATMALLMPDGLRPIPTRNLCPGSRIWAAQMLIAV